MRRKPSGQLISIDPHEKAIKQSGMQRCEAAPSPAGKEASEHMAARFHPMGGLQVPAHIKLNIANMVWHPHRKLGWKVGLSNLHAA